MDAISEEAFLKWESSVDPAEVEGRGVTVKSTLQFFTWLKETDDNDNDED